MGINNKEIIYLEIRNIFRVRKCKLAVERGTAVVFAMSTAQHQAFLPFPVTHVFGKYTWQTQDISLVDSDVF